MSSGLSSEAIKAEAHGLGFFACGIAMAEPLDREARKGFMRWIESGGHATMGYMERNVEKRLDPRLLMEGARRIVSVAMNYSPGRTLPQGGLQVAAYALGMDYHVIMRERLHALAGRLGLERYRALCDTAPVMERYWAARAGIGWVGRNHQLIIPRAGSMFFLGELLIDAEVDCDPPMEPGCGNCTACLEACPTGALGDGKGPDGAAGFDSSRCLSFLTIESRGEIPPEAARSMGDTFYGCDRCQAACPWNRFSRPTEEEGLKASEDLLSMTREKWRNLTEDGYRRLFRGSAVKRAGYTGLMRNIRAVLGAEGEGGNAEAQGTRTHSQDA